jgi:hypothetical protein
VSKTEAHLLQNVAVELQTVLRLYRTRQASKLLVFSFSDLHRRFKVTAREWK